MKQKKFIKNYQKNLMYHLMIVEALGKDIEDMMKLELRFVLRMIMILVTIKWLQLEIGIL